MGVLVGIDGFFFGYAWAVLRSLPDGFEEYLMSELIGIAGTFLGAVKHDASSMAIQEPKSNAKNFKLAHYQ
jgi:hypothetical protein